MRPSKLSSKVFLELPPVLAHYIEPERNLWLSGNPKRGRVTFMERSGSFTDLESLAVERRNLLSALGLERARAMKYKIGFEQGRRDGARHLKTFNDNTRLALQASLVFGQVQGKFIAESVKFEFDLNARTLYREVALDACAEAIIHRMTLADTEACSCWGTAGYLAGHVSEILGRKVLTIETECQCLDAENCRFISKFDSEWGGDAKGASDVTWAREALTLISFDQELKQRDDQIERSRMATRKAQGALNGLNRRMRSELLLDAVVAGSDAMAPVANRARQLVETGAPVLISGESGTGKATLARSIHYGGARKSKPFVELDCAGLTGALLLQELLGYAEGAVSGAVSGHKGALVRANGGTLFVSDLSKVSLDAQGHLARALATKQVTPLGADKPQPANVRIIAALDRDPAKAVAKKVVREDLYFAIAIGRIDLPPLRERETDIIRLAETFLAEFKTLHDRPSVEMSAEFRQILLESAWPGNVRQLRNVVEHAVIMTNGEILEPRHLPEEILASRWTRHPQVLTEEVIRATLSRTHNNRTKAAELLGVGRTTLWRSMKKLGIA
jgi:DNA-binding NtrC family response regulator/predicted hydrocarbon binding protein